MVHHKDSELPDLTHLPREPELSECYGRNCEHCIYVYYEEAFKHWREKIELLKNDFKKSNTILTLS
jgi:hypothetical protein